MALSRYSQYKIIIAPDSKKRQGLRTGDVVRRQYTDGEITRYSLMVVLDTGTDIVAGPEGTDLNSPYFIGALLEGDEPRDGELLDFVRMTSLTDQARSGAMYTLRHRTSTLPIWMQSTVWAANILFAIHVRPGSMGSQEKISLRHLTGTLKMVFPIFFA